MSDEPKPSIQSSRRTFLKRTLAGCAAAAGTDSLLIEPNWFHLNVVQVPIKGLDSAFDGYRIGLISDFHTPRWLSPRQMGVVNGLMSSFRPDIVAMPGDFVAQRRKVTEVPDFSETFGRLHAPDGVFATLGNHDHWTDARMVRAQLVHNTAARLIERRHEVIRRGSAKLAVAGVGDLWMDASSIGEALEGVSVDVPRIVLAHNPDQAETCTDDVRVDLMLSGHTHGGQVRIPYKGAVKLPSAFGQKFEQGLVQGKAHRVYVTRGLCTMAFVRFNCRPEVTGIVLKAV